MHLPHDQRAIASGASGVVWLLGLWFAAPVLRARTPSQRLAAAMALGCLIPLILGLIDLLYWWSVWVALGILLASRFWPGGRERSAGNPPAARPWDLAIGLTVLLALAWPLAVRPSIDGDTLIYHLPNAASWVAQHGVWTTGTRYWWYPPASELFASGLLAAGGIGVVGWAGLLPAGLLMLTVRAAAQRGGAPPIAGTLAACALLATPVAAVQVVSLQNDVWLTALFLCALTECSLPAFGTLAITKPYGLLFAAMAGAACADRKLALRALVLSCAGMAVWVVRDLILLPGAILPAGTTIAAGATETTIAARMPHSLVVLATASWHAGIVWLAFLAAGVASVVFSSERRLRWAALTAIVLFAVVPTGYEGGTVQQLATGASLRFGLPVAALGLMWLVSFARRAVPVFVTAAAAAVVAGVVTQWRLFYSDSTTHDTPVVVVLAALIAGGCVLLANPRLRTSAIAVAFISLGALAGGLAQSHPADYIADTYGGGFTYAKSEHFERVITLGLPAGAAVTVDPNVSAFDGSDDGACEEARALDAVLVTTPARMPVGCGRVLYRDASTAVLRP